ncbi:hypothetical protein EBH_0034060 [Eimeria brunetti]|uniref:Protein kinase domain-containing protein n=1 Tax=Eimeria brunetti TaxID=51314 RepID=U6LJZ8_9EIME|nr:hypothetical protein EBH_0034060 [Eimeria brunetti]
MIGELRNPEGQESLVPPTKLGESIQTDVPVQGNAYSSIVDTEASRRRQWKQYFPYLLTLGVAGALLFNLFRRVPEAAYGPLLVSASGGDDGGVRNATQSLVMPSGSTADPRQQQQQAEDMQTHPAEVGKEATLFSSVATLPLFSAEDQLLHYDMWGLPMLDHFEMTLPPDVKRGRDEIAAFLAKGHMDKEASSEEDSYELSVVARTLSNGSSDSLVGMTMVLKNVKPLQWMEKGGHLPRIARVNEILGTGASSIVVEAEDLVTHELFAMRILRQGLEAAQWFPTDESFIGEMQRELDFEQEAARQLCGTIPANMVASKKGVAVPLYTADIAGAPEAKRVDKYFILGRVQLMERLYGAVIDLLIDAGEVVQKAREYMARRLLQIVLKIQQAGISHNDLKWDNVLLRSDGSFLVSDLGSSFPFGSPYRQLTFYTPQYREPQLALRQDPEAYDSGFTIPEASSDLWSLGILLYELFTGNTYPYGQAGAEDTDDQEVLLATWLTDSNTRSASLKPGLEAAKVPHRWMQLIVRLLEPSRRHRITAWGILEEFSDLLHYPE